MGSRGGGDRGSGGTGAFVAAAALVVPLAGDGRQSSALAIVHGVVEVVEMVEMAGGAAAGCGPPRRRDDGALSVVGRLAPRFYCFIVAILRSSVLFFSLLFSALRVHHLPAIFPLLG